MQHDPTLRSSAVHLNVCWRLQRNWRILQTRIRIECWPSASTDAFDPKGSVPQIQRIFCRFVCLESTKMSQLFTFDLCSLWGFYQLFPSWRYKPCELLWRWNQMNVVVIGAGIIGMFSSYYLAASQICESTVYPHLLFLGIFSSFMVECFSHLRTQACSSQHRKPKDVRHSSTIPFQL